MERRENVPRVPLAGPEELPGPPGVPGRVRALLQAVAGVSSEAEPDPVLRRLAEALRVPGECHGTARQVRGGAPAGDEALVAALAATAGVAIENARLKAEARRREKWQRATSAVTQRLLSEDEPGDVLAVVVQRAREISGADLVMLALPAAAGDYLVVEKASGARAESAIGQIVPFAGSASGIVMNSGEPLSVDNFSTDSRVAHASVPPLPLGQAVVCPLGPPGDVRGVMTAAQKSGSRPLSRDAVEKVTAFAAQAGIGLRLNEHRHDVQRIALLADRDRIARDLHDQVIQRLFATGMSLQGVLPLVPDAGAADRVRRAVDELDQTIRDIRSAIYTLHSRDEQELTGVRPRIVSVVEEMTAALGFAPWLRIDGRLDAHVPAGIGEDMLLALREALANVARHARADRVSVTVELGGDLAVIVSDNGVGIDEATRQAGRWSGLANLTERAAELGGSLTIVRRDRGGTQLEWRVPLPARTA
jgi:signal transduction histidine kinase